MMSSQKPHRIRVRVLDGKPREPNKLKGQLVPHVDVIDVNSKVEFVICALKPNHLDQVRTKFGSAGIEEVPGGVVDIPPSTGGSRSSDRGSGRPVHQRSRQGYNPQRPAGAELSKKPYGFVRLPDTFATREPVWHDGTTSAGRLSGEVRCEMENLTPLLVGWERRRIDDDEEAWPVPSVPAHGSDLEAFLQRAARQVHPDPDDSRRQRDVDRARQEYVSRIRDVVVEVPGAGRTVVSKSLLCPLRAPWGERPVILPGDSLKGQLRHELGALFGAPMERVAERSYSYRPNLKFPDQQSMRRLEPRLARVRANGSICVNGESFPVPDRIDILHMATRNEQTYYPRRDRRDVVQLPADAEPYRGGLGGGRRLPDACLSADARRRMIHTHLDVGQIEDDQRGVQVPAEVHTPYQRTLEHMLSSEHGHFSSRHPQVGTDQTAQQSAVTAVRQAAQQAFQVGDLIWVEWDSKKKRVVSFGWHYFYRWAYADTARKEGWSDERRGLFPLEAERTVDEEGAPQDLSAVRRLFGYTGDNDGSRGIGQGDHSQLMGRISVNAAMEVVPTGSKDEDRFLPPTFLKELGMPRPSAVEFYLEQPHHPNPRPWDQASLFTYGDAAGYDEPGQLAGRKFYLDRADAYTGEPWKDDLESNRLNDRSTLALEASQPHRRFRFTVRFRDLDSDELAALLLALCPHQFSEAVGGDHAEGYCSKLGYARPLGWGTVRIEAKELHVLDDATDGPVLAPVPDVPSWFETHFQRPPMLQSWLGVHRCKHPDAGDYPRKDGQIHTFHTTLRAEHTRWRRYDRTNS